MIKLKDFLKIDDTSTYFCFEDIKEIKHKVINKQSLLLKVKYLDFDIFITRFQMEYDLYNGDYLCTNISISISEENKQKLIDILF